MSYRRTTSLPLVVVVTFCLLVIGLGACSQLASTTPAATPTLATRLDTATTVAVLPYATSGDPMPNPPPVANASAARKYRGVTLTYYGDSVGFGHEIDLRLADRFTADTGIYVDIIPSAESVTTNYANHSVLFASRSPDLDVLMIDVVWTASFAQHLVDLAPALGDEAQAHYPGIVENNIIDERLVAIPWFVDFGILYYRTDLLTKYGFEQPPQTWDQLEHMAQTIQDGERAEGNANFVGFVWQGAAYEGLTCNVLEWVYSHGGGKMIDGEAVNLDSTASRSALARAQRWIGTISPETVTSFLEEDARRIFQNGNAAFMRNWPYAYAACNVEGSPIRGNFDAAPLPHVIGQSSAGTVGGWQLAVSAYSQNPAAAIEYVRYITSPEVQRWRAMVGGHVPTIPALADDEDVIAALPFLAKMEGVVLVTRPSRETGQYYTTISQRLFEGVSDILRGAPVEETVPRIQADWQNILQQVPEP